MPGDPKECRKHARNCLRFAEASANAEITRTFVEQAGSVTGHEPKGGHSDDKKRASAQLGLIGR